jgi:Uma2 family endonuclease
MAYSAPADSDRTLTFEEFEQLPEEELYKLELVRGLLIREPKPGPGSPHGIWQARLIAALSRFADEHGGAVMGPVAWVMPVPEPVVLVPDISYAVAGRRIPHDAPNEPFAPDLIVELISPSQKVADLQAKILEYLRAGVRLAWLIDPRTRSVTAYRSTDDIRILVGDDALLDGADVLPGFRIPLSELFRT